MGNERKINQCPAASLSCELAPASSPRVGNGDPGLGYFLGIKDPDLFGPRLRRHGATHSSFLAPPGARNAGPPKVRVSTTLLFKNTVLTSRLFSYWAIPVPPSRVSFA